MNAGLRDRLSDRPPGPFEEAAAESVRREVIAQDAEWEAWCRERALPEDEDAWNAWFEEAYASEIGQELLYEAEWLAEGLPVGYDDERFCDLMDDLPSRPGEFGNQEFERFRRDVEALANELVSELRWARSVRWGSCARAPRRVAARSRRPGRRRARRAASRSPGGGSDDGPGEPASHDVAGVRA